MGCFLGCFGSSKVKDERINPRNSQFHSYRNQDKRHQYNPVQNNVTPTLTQIPTVVPNQDILQKPVNLLVPESQFKQEEKEHLSLLDKDNLEEKIQLSSGTRKKVTFDSNVKEYEHISYDEDEVHENMQESEKEAEKKVTEDNLKPITSSSLSEGSTLSSLGSFPPNHRYQNCRESDDEDDELDCEVSDMDDEEYDDEEVYDDGFSDDEYNSRLVHEYTRSCTSVESSTKSFAACVDDDVYSDRGTKIPEVFSCGARDRAGYVHSVLNPVENTAQWKTVKVKGTPCVKDQKENFQMNLGFQQFSSKSKSKFNDHEIAVAASLSAWLVSSQSTPPSKANPIGLEPPSAESVSSHGSNYVKSEEERPILGALTVEELRQFSSTYSPRRSPCRSPDERVLLGTVGVHWNERNNVGDGTSSVSSLNDIPNTNRPILRANIKRYT